MSRRNKDELNYEEIANLQLVGIDMLFTDLKNYQNLIELFLKSEQNELEKRFKETNLEIESRKAGEHHREYYNHLVDSFSQRHYELAGLFPHNFRCFFLTQCISTIVLELKKICNSYGNYKNIDSQVDDLSGFDELQKCKDYLKLNAKINFRNFDPEWQFLKHCKSLRNDIVHQGEKVKSNKKNKALIQFIENHKSLESSKEINNIIAFTIIDKNLTDELLKNTAKFIEKLLDELSNAADKEICLKTETTTEQTI